MSGQPVEVEMTETHYRIHKHTVVSIFLLTFASLANTVGIVIHAATR